MSDPAINSSLLVAALDLNLVKLIRQAMRTADLTSATATVPAHPVVGGSPKPVAAGDGVQTRYIRNSERPAATFEPYRVHNHHARCNELRTYTCTDPVQPAANPPFIQPPWKVLPWPSAPSPIHSPGYRRIKVPPNRVDESSVGRTLDLFI